MYESRMDPDVLSELRSSVDLMGPEAAIGIEDFRRFHMLEFGASSVGYLDIPNLIFQILVKEAIDTLDQLEKELPLLIKKYPSLADRIQIPSVEKGQFQPVAL